MSDEETQTKFKELKALGKQLARDGNFEMSLDVHKKAYDLVQCPQVKKRIEKIEAHISELKISDNEDEDDMVDLGNGFHLYKGLFDKLYSYQREGVAWMYKLHKNGKGGILGDDMGLGKTIQIISFISGLYDAGESKTFLIAMPVSLIQNWINEFQKWAPGMDVESYHGISKNQREKALYRTQNRGGVLLTSYGILVTSANSFCRKSGSNFVWDYVILDEGHKIKNPTKTTKAAHEISARHRLVLTGTPIQNNLRELWSLYDFCHFGTLLGTLTTFRLNYETPIMRSREKDATIGEKRLGIEISENLKKRIDPYFLRRTKQETLEGKAADNNNIKRLTKKNDLIVWLYLSKTQIAIYDDFLKLDHIKHLLMTTRSPLVELTVLKKICDHPRLLSKNACGQLGLDGTLNEDDMMVDENQLLAVGDIPDETLIEESGKLQVLLSLLENLREEGHRTLIFSLSRKMLDIINKILTNRNWKVSRLDGTVKKMDERQKLIDRFQKDSSISVFLLTTQVGGVGLTLTAADRVVIYDPSWNPAVDSQAVDRAYRIGQNKNVVVYRLITCGTIEEKIYRRQIFKDSITRQATGGAKQKDPHRYFTKNELRELFVLDDPTKSTTHEQLQSLHSGQRNYSMELDRHIAFLHSIDILGISDHDLMFQGIHQEVCNLDEHETNFVRAMVEKAEIRITADSEMNKQLALVTGEYRGPVDSSTRPKAPKLINIPDKSEWPPLDEESIIITDDDEDDNICSQLDISQITIKESPQIDSKSDRKILSHKSLNITEYSTDQIKKSPNISSQDLIDFKLNPNDSNESLKKNSASANSPKKGFNFFNLKRNSSRVLDASHMIISSSPKSPIIKSLQNSPHGSNKNEIPQSAITPSLIPTGSFHEEISLISDDEEDIGPKRKLGYRNCINDSNIDASIDKAESSVRDDVEMDCEDEVIIVNPSSFSPLMSENVQSTKNKRRSICRRSAGLEKSLNSSNEWIDDEVLVEESIDNSSISDKSDHSEDVVEESDDDLPACDF